MIKKINVVFIVAFFVIILVPTITTNMGENAISEKDNRELAPEPISASFSGIRYADAVNSYMNDRIGFRENFITLNGMINYYFFHNLTSNNVLLGSDGWLFYTGDLSIPQYLGTAIYSEDELKRIADALTQTEDYLNRRNCEFVLFIAPNKERVYADYMPEKYKKMRKSSECCTDQVVNYLRSNTDIHVVWPYEDIMNFRTQYPDLDTYHKLDTHWNQLGGYIGARALLKELGIDIPKPLPSDFIKSISDTGDLKTMMSLNVLQMTDIDYIPKNYPIATSTFTDGGFYNQWIYENKDKDSRRILIRRDSFTTAMRSVIGSSFNYVDMCHASSFVTEMIDQVNPDVFVLEIIERYDDGLFEFVLQEPDEVSSK